MNTETIIQLAMSACSLVSIILYMIMFYKVNKKSAKQTLEDILKLTPNYVAMAKAAMPTGSTMQITNYVLAMIKSECESAKVKFKETKAKETIEKEM